jgi:hypothetical protein
MRKSIWGTSIVFVICMLLALPVLAVDIDLSGASSGTLIVAPGGSFAQTFAGQTVSGISIVGSPTNPLTLAPSGWLDVAFWDGSNSILPQPGNAAPLSLLLDSYASAISWRMGYADGSGPIRIDFFAANGSLVQTVNQTLSSGYNNYSFSGFGNFMGLTISENIDGAGLRYQNFSYNAVATPIPGTVLLLGTGFAALIGLRKKVF